MGVQLNLTEREIEEWIYCNPDRLRLGIEGWIGRQYVLPSGIADLIDYTDDPLAVVIEVKNVPLNKAALAQVSRYAADVAEIVSWKDRYCDWTGTGSPFVRKVLFGPSIDRQTQLEADAMGIEVMLFEPALAMVISSPMDADRVYRQVKLSRMADQEEWRVFNEVPPPNADEDSHDSSC